MKRIYVLAIILTTICTTSSGQIQQGIVRTAGTATKKGEPLQNVVVRVAGSTSVLSDESGRFTLALSGVSHDGDVFQITSVRKSGYELLDKDGLRNRFVYSRDVPVEIVMISSAELIRSKQEIEERARRNATRNYEQKVQSLKRQLEQQELSILEYNVQIHNLEQKMELFEELIVRMADHYSRTDYDKLDSLNAEINRCIADGELDKADSLINTKGDVVERANENMEKGRRLHAAEVKLDCAKNKADNNSKSLEEERKLLETWVKQQEQTKKRK